MRERLIIPTSEQMFLNQPRLRPEIARTSLGRYRIQARRFTAMTVHRRGPRQNSESPCFQWCHGKQAAGTRLGLVSAAFGQMPFRETEQGLRV